MLPGEFLTQEGTFVYPENIWENIVGVLQQLEVLHNVLKKAHCDIKPENIVLVRTYPTNKKRFSMVLIDYSFCKNLGETNTFPWVVKPSTFGILSPETSENKPPLNPNGYEKFDVWCLGMSFCYHVFGMYPFGVDDGSKLSPSDNPVYLPPYQISEESERFWKWLVEHFLDFDPLKRSSCSEILKSVNMSTGLKK